MNRRTKYLLLALVLIIATFLRCYHLSSTPPGLYPDEAINGNDASVAAATGHYRVFYPNNNGREGLYMNLIGLEFQLFHAPHDPWVVRLPAAIAGILAVLGLYFLVSELLGDGMGLLASFFFATSFWAVDLSRIGFRAILAPMFLIWALWLFLKAIRAPAARERAAGWYAALAGAVYGLGFYSYIAYRITPLLFLVFIPYFARGKHRSPHFFRRTAIFIAAAFVAAAPIGWYFARHPADFFGRTAEISVATAHNPLVQFAVNAGKELLMFNWRGDSNWRQNISGAPELFFPVGILFLVGIAAAIFSLFRSRREGSDVKPAAGESMPGEPARDWKNFFMFPAFPLALSFAWFLLALLPAALSNESIPHALRSILMLPPALIFAAAGGAALYRLIKSRHRGAAYAVAAIFAATVALGGWAQYFVVWARNPNVRGAFAENYVEIGQEINALPARVPKYVVVQAGGVPVNGIPMPVETTMFITRTFTPSGQAAKNVHYLLPDQAGTIPPGAAVFTIR